jgi:hypothetical protein
MRVLLDEQLPIDLSPELRGHVVDTVVGRGWAGVKNGELLHRMKRARRSVEAECRDPIGPHEPVLCAEHHPLQIGLRND